MSMLQELNEDKCEMEMTPMIDVTFLLLIFFLCTLKFKLLEGKLQAGGNTCNHGSRGHGHRNGRHGCGHHN